ncbi:arginine N-succinyltransferase [Massilia sp. GCM10023247]|uniref:arginine N-succinyltransferase n=1 Tax=Massilia sp. GCM10023247 TaxID=3252643 RepID=UPI00360A7BC6
MLVIRSIAASDLDPLIEIARQVGGGMTTLKPDRKMLGDRVECAVASFAGTIPPEERDYMFVMEDTGNGQLAGICAIKGAVGLTEPFYNYRIGTLVHSSRELGVFTRMETLYLSNDLTGATELCSLFLQPDYRTGYNGKWLSKSRFLFIAQFQQLFTEKIIAEMRGYLLEDGTSPFYEGLGRHFFKMDFNHVDSLTAMGKKSFIAELMPRQPLYVDYLPESAREVIGQVHRSTLPARKLLEQEGMHYEGYVDIFDAGPVLQGRVKELRSVRDSVLRVAAEGRPEGETECLLVSNTRLDDFRMVLAQATVDGLEVPLSAQELALLHVQAGDPVRTLSLNVRKNNG